MGSISAGLMAKIVNPDGTINMEKLQAVAKNSADEFSAEAEALLQSGLTGDKAAQEGPGDIYNREKATANTIASLKNYEGPTLWDDVNPILKGIGKFIIALTPLGWESCGEKITLPEENITFNVNTTVKNKIEIAIQGAAAQSDPKLAATLSAILAAIKAGNEIEANNGIVLDKILKILESIDSKATTTADGVTKLVEGDKVKVALLTQILAKVESLENGQNDMSDAAKTFYTTLLAKLDKMSDDQVNFYTSLLTKFGDKTDAIIDLLGNLQGGNVDLSTVEGLLAQILAREKANGQVLLNTYDKIDLMKVTLEAIKPTLEQESKEIKKWLKDIFDKIKPCEGHNCDHSTLEAILAEIKVLIEKIKDTTQDPHHEGILDDLDNIFG